MNGYLFPAEIDGFLQYLHSEKRYSNHTIIAYRNDLWQFISFLNFPDFSRIQQTELNDVRDWAMNMREEGIAARSINRKVSSLRALFRYWQKMGLTKKNPTAAFKNLKLSKPLPNVVTESGIKTLRERVYFEPGWQGLRDKLLLELLYNTGLRRTELVNLKINDIDFQRNEIKVTGKRNKQRIIPVLDAIRVQIEDYMEATKLTFEDYNPDFLLLSNKGKKISEKLVYDKVKFYLRLVATNAKLSPHTLRHSFATHLLDHGADINAVKELLGHSSLAATQVYTHNTIEKLKSTYTKYHPKNQSKNE